MLNFRHIKSFISQTTGNFTSFSWSVLLWWPVRQHWANPRRFFSALFIFVSRSFFHTGRAYWYRYWFITHKGNVSRFYNLHGYLLIHANKCSDENSNILMIINASMQRLIRQYPKWLIHIDFAGYILNHQNNTEDVLWKQKYIWGNPNPAILISFAAIAMVSVSVSLCKFSFSNFERVKICYIHWTIGCSHIFTRKSLFYCQSCSFHNVCLDVNDCL
jgi:hypothetical protein